MNYILSPKIKKGKNHPFIMQKGKIMLTCKQGQVQPREVNFIPHTLSIKIGNTFPNYKGERSIVRKTIKLLSHLNKKD